MHKATTLKGFLEPEEREMLHDAYQNLVKQLEQKIQKGGEDAKEAKERLQQVKKEIYDNLDYALGMVEYAVLTLWDGGVPEDVKDTLEESFKARDSYRNMMRSYKPSGDEAKSSYTQTENFANDCKTLMCFGVLC